MTATSTRKTAVITGVAGQDGTILADHLVEQGYQVIGVVKPGFGAAVDKQPRALRLVEADICDLSTLSALLMQWRPSEVYHLAAVHHSTQDNSSHVNLRARQVMLETNFGSIKSLAFAILESGLACHLVFAASSQMYSAMRQHQIITESSPRNPSTFYGHIKSWGVDLLAFLRSESGLCASSAVLFNHESPFRKPQFVSRKITKAAAAARLGRPIPLNLLNIGSRVDWSSARDIVQALHLMASSKEPRDYVVSSGELQSVRRLLEIAFGHVGLDWREFTTFRSDCEEHALCGQPRLLETTLGWRRTRSFVDIVVEMVDHDIELLQSAS